MAAAPTIDASAPGTPPRTNWSGNYRYTAKTVYEPASIAAVQLAVRSATSVRALGTRHSFNSLADSADAQISTSRLDDVLLDRDAHTVTVGSGIRYGELARILHLAGFALHNLASLPHISVGGACATATHGSGITNGNLATAVRAIQFVDGDGNLQTLSRERHPAQFPGAVVGIGALGIVTHLTLAVQPTYQMTQTLYERLPLRALEAHLPAILGAGYSVSIFTDWQPLQGQPTGTVWIKQRVDTQAQPPAPAPAEFFGAQLATRKLHPIPAHPAEACTDQLGHAGAWYERLPHFQLDFTPSSGQELQTEYFVPLEHAFAAIQAVAALAHRIAPHLLISELRTVEADDLWLSMAYQRRSLAIHFTWRLDVDAVMALLPHIEAALKPFAARPHWGKLFTIRAGELRALYPRLVDFLALARTFDPHGKFRNAFLDACLETAVTAGL